MCVWFPDELGSAAEPATRAPDLARLTWVSSPWPKRPCWSPGLILDRQEPPPDPAWPPPQPHQEEWWRSVFTFSGCWRCRLNIPPETQKPDAASTIQSGAGSREPTNQTPPLGFRPLFVGKHQLSRF